MAETVALSGPESLSDAQLIEAMLNRVRPGRAEEILHQVESLGRLVALGPAELQALGLTKGEMGRFAILDSLASLTRMECRPKDPKLPSIIRTSVSAPYHRRVLELLEVTPL